MFSPGRRAYNYTFAEWAGKKDEELRETATAKKTKKEEEMEALMRSRAERQQEIVDSQIAVLSRIQQRKLHAKARQASAPLHPRRAYAKELHDRAAEIRRLDSSPFAYRVPKLNFERADE